MGHKWWALSSVEGKADKACDQNSSSLAWSNNGIFRPNIGKKRPLFGRILSKNGF